MPSVREIRSLDEAQFLRPLADTVAPKGNAPPRLQRALQRHDLDRFAVAVSVSQEESLVPKLGDSYAYELQVDDQGIRIEAASDYGAITACSVLNALCWQEGSLPYCHLVDEPQYAWRGLMIDASRHFLPIEKLRETVDLMACYRLNVLHLHLSDDQACRFPSDRFERLAAEEHYSKTELTDLVDYAADRAIRVVPELDVPGHTTSWVSAYPEWGAGELAGPSTGFGVHQGCLDPTKSAVREAVKHIFSELADVFPDEYVHVGGDEVNSTWWNANDAIQAWMLQHRMRSPQELQTWFIRDLGDYVATLNKRLIGWDEILDENLPKDYVVQAWRGLTARDHAMAAGHKTLVSSPYYLDLMFPADGYYRFEPQMASEEATLASKQLEEDVRVEHVRDGVRWQVDFGEFPSLTRRSGGEILGGEACMWSEIVDADTLHTRVWSRMPAIAERLWSGADSLAVEAMYQRLEQSAAYWGQFLGIDLLRIPDRLNPTALQPLIEQLEPIKWYSRHIGLESVKARTSGQSSSTAPRPYDLATKLDRVVDFLPPESFTARRTVAKLLSNESLTTEFEGWRTQAQKFAACADDEPKLAELQSISQRLALLADVYEGRRPIDYSLCEPIGEYLLPIAKPILNAVIQRVAEQFGITGSVREVTQGHINDTFVIEESLLLQRINGEIFDADALVENRSEFDAWIHDLVPRQVESGAGLNHVTTALGEVWRASEFVLARNFDVLPTELCAAAGEAFGTMLARLKPCIERPREVIQGFHNIDRYLQAFDAAPKAEDAQSWIDFVNARRDSLTQFDEGEYQVIHGDCKVNNLLFELDADRVIKVVDLDTLMWGHPAWDFGDLIRSVGTGGGELAAEQDRLRFAVQGFTESYPIDKHAVATFARAPAFMSFMLGVRFLTDHLIGDKYFKVARTGENLERAAEQFGLNQKLEDSAAAIANLLLEANQKST